jgi:two-component system OmpR family sensor kinase
VPPAGPAALPVRFVPGRDVGAGSGTGLAIVRTGAGRIGPPPRLMSPRAGKDTGFSACICLHGVIVQKQEHSR